MAIIRWDPFKDFLDIQNEFNRLFQRSFGLETRKGNGRRANWMPATDIYEEKDNLVIKAELPGLKIEDIDVSVEDDHLVIKGERKFSEEIKEENYYRIERRYGSFERQIPLPDYVKKEDVKADYKEGLLTITLSKMEEVKPKKIKVSIEGSKEK